MQENSVPPQQPSSNLPAVFKDETKPYYNGRGSCVPTSTPKNFVPAAAGAAAKKPTQPAPVSIPKAEPVPLPAAPPVAAPETVVKDLPPLADSPLPEVPPAAALAAAPPLPTASGDAEDASPSHRKQAPAGETAEGADRSPTLPEIQEAEEAAPVPPSALTLEAIEAHMKRSKPVRAVAPQRLDNNTKYLAVALVVKEVMPVLTKIRPETGGASAYQRWYNFISALFDKIGITVGSSTIRMNAQPMRRIVATMGLQLHNPTQLQEITALAVDQLHLLIADVATNLRHVTQLDDLAGLTDKLAKLDVTESGDFRLRDNLAAAATPQQATKKSNAGGRSAAKTRVGTKTPVTALTPASVRKASARLTPFSGTKTAAASAAKVVSRK